MKKGLEIRRQLSHMICGTLLICLYLGVLYFLPNLNPIIPALFLAIVAVVFALLAQMNLMHKIWGINFLVDHLEREENVKKFPGKGYVMFLFGAAVSIFIFPPLIAISAIAIVTFGDSTATLFGKLFGKIKFKNNKTLEGSIAGLIFSLIAASVFIPFFDAFIACFVASVIEGSSNNNFLFDDNFFIPIFAGITLLIIGGF